MSIFVFRKFEDIYRKVKNILKTISICENIGLLLFLSSNLYKYLKSNSTFVLVYYKYKYFSVRKMGG